MPAETLKPRVDWLDEERRKDKATLGRLEEKLAAAEAGLAAQSKQMQELSAQVARVYTKFQPGQIEELLAHHREDLQRTIETMEKRRLDAEEKGAKLRSSEREANERALADMHRQLAALAELQRTMESRREEQVRLSSALQEARKTLDGLVRRDEERVRVIAAMEETRRQDIRRLGEIQGEMQALRQKFNESGARLESLETGARRAETRLGELSAADLERRNAAAVWQEQQNALASERERQWKEWERTLSALAATMKDNSERMETYTETHRAMRQALDDTRQQSERTEQRLHEMEELLRLTTDRLRQEWGAYLADDQKRWTAQGLSADDRWREHDRREQKALDRLTRAEDLLGDASDQAQARQEADRARLESLADLLREWLARLESGR
jgi:chromosome segregation ATPase